MVEPLRMDYAVNDAEVIAAFKRQQNELEKERKARVELQKQINDNSAAQRAADKSAADSSKAFAAEQARLASAAAKIADSVRTPLQQYRNGLVDLIDHYKSGRLTQDEYLAAGDKLKKQYQDQSGITAKLAEKQREVAETAKAAKAEQDKLVAAAAKIAESVRTPIQEYKEKLAEVSGHYKSGRLSAEQYAAAVSKLKTQYQDASGMTAQLTEAEKRQNEEMRAAQRIIESNLTAQQKYERNVAQIAELHAKGRLTLEQYNAAVAAEKTSLDKSSGTGDSAKALAAEQARLAMAAAKISESVRTPLQQYKISLAELIDHYKSGRLTQDEYLAAGDKLKRQYQDQSGITAKLAEKQRELAETAKAAKAEQDKLVAAAAKIAESVRTPIQEYKARLAEVSEHYKSGRINAEQYTLAVSELKSEYQDASGMTARMTEAEKKKNEEIRDAKRIIEANLTAQQKYERNIAQITDLHKKGRLTLEQYNAAVAAEKSSLDKSFDSGDKFGGMLGGLGAKVAGAAAGFASMGTVISFIKAEYDALLERQGKSKDANISLAAEQEALLMNLGDANAKDVTAQISKVSTDAKIKEVDVTRAVNEAMAARADLSVQDVIEGVSTAAKVRKFAPAELAGLASAAIDTRKQTGLGTEESMGFLMQLQAQSRTKNLKGLAENFTPAVGGVMNFGADRQTAGAMLAALSHGMGDTTGATTATSAIQLAKQLREYGSSRSPELQKQMADIDKKYEGQKESLTEKFDRMRAGLSSKKMPAEIRAEEKLKIDAEERKAKQELKDSQAAESERLMAAAPAVPIGEVLSRMQKDKEYRDQFLRGKDQGGFGASFEAKALPAIESLLSGGVQAQQYETARAALRANPLDTFKASIAARDLPSMKLAEFGQGFGNTADQMAINDKAGATSAIVRDGLKEIRDRMGKTTISSSLDTVINDVTTGGMQDEATALRSLEGVKSGLKPAKLKVLEQVQKEGSYDFNKQADREAFNRVAGERYRSTPEGKSEQLLESLIAEIKGLREEQKQKAHAGAVIGRAREGAAR